MNARELLELFKEVLGLWRPIAEMEEMIKNPNWKEYNRIHNWKNYIDRKFQQRWNKLSDEVKVCLFVLAEKRAEDEDWD